MPHAHKAGEPHVTQTFGVGAVEPVVMVMVYRTRPERGEADEDERRRIIGVMNRWVDRYAHRNDLIWTNLTVSAVGSGNEDDPPDAIVASFFAIKVPADWLCFGSLIARAILPPMPALLPLTSLFDFDLDVEREPDAHDVAEAEIDGQKVAVGTQKRTTN